MIKTIEMEKLIICVILLIASSSFIYLMMKGNRYDCSGDNMRKRVAAILALSTVIFGLDIFAGECTFGRILFNLLMAIVPISIISLSIWKDSWSRRLVYIFIAAGLAVAIHYMLVALGLMDMMPSSVFMSLSAILIITLPLSFVFALIRRLVDVSSLMQCGNTWTFLCLGVDVVHCLIITLEAVVTFICILLLENSFIWILPVMFILLSAVIPAYAHRAVDSTQFIFMRKHETRVLEAMKILPVEGAGVGGPEDDTYKEIYDRVVQYFDEEKPYLSSNLTINDICQAVFSNRLYISRAISRYTGRNFCQFVNYHRVIYSMEYFRSDTNLKVAEIWPVCGFNSIVSFSMAFRLFVGLNPSEWCRKEKIRLSRNKK